jgi:hypothetical protein
MLSLDVRQNPETVDLDSTHAIAALAGDVRRAWPELREPLALRWSDEPVLALDRGRPWLYGPIERDPLARGGRTVVPRAQMRQLKKLAARNIPVQRLAMAHELDPDGPVRHLTPMLRHGPRTCTDDVAKAVVGPLPPHPGLARTARALEGLVATASYASAGALHMLLDPIIFGVIAPTRPISGQPSLWYPLVAWRW